SAVGYEPSGPAVSSADGVPLRTGAERIARPIGVRSTRPQPAMLITTTVTASAAPNRLVIDVTESPLCPGRLHLRAQLAEAAFVIVTTSRKLWSQPYPEATTSRKL